MRCPSCGSMLNFEGIEAFAKHRIYTCQAKLFGGAARLGVGNGLRVVDCNTAIDMTTGQQVERATFQRGDRLEVVQYKDGR